jgi:2,4-dienoyl-CoA reductase (NADPH2)
MMRALTPAAAPAPSSHALRPGEKPMILEPFTIKNVEFKNRIVRSSMGGRTSYYDGTVTAAWANFERRFAAHGIAAIISATIDVDEDRISPLEYPKISHDRFIKPLRRGVRAVQKEGCKYIMQIGDAGGHTQTSLFTQKADAMSASAGFDLIFGYRNRTYAMSEGDVEREVVKFADAARRVQKAGCDGVEVTASKGYIIHQFLNPMTNRRRDAYGGDMWKRFRLLREVVEAVRAAVGPDFLFGVRLSAKDFNYLPLDVRWPPRFFSKERFVGNTLKQTIEYGKRLKELGVDYLHIDSGFGFVNPKGNPGPYPIDGVKIFLNATRHLSAKAGLRAAVVNAMPTALARALLGVGWKLEEGVNADFAAEFKRQVGLPVIANGGFQRRSLSEQTLAEGKCDLVAVARPLLANPDLLKIFETRDVPENPCTFCSLCCTKTAVLPLGCYEPKRFLDASGNFDQTAMENQILEWSSNTAELDDEDEETDGDEEG